MSPKDAPHAADPQTDMPKTFDAAEAEGRITRAWLDAKAFAAGANKSRDEHFSIVIPPPNVTGALHMGHAFNNTLQDVLTRWHRMLGFDTLWQPGFDHAGIATQMVTEREMAANGEPSRAEMGREAFERRVWQQKKTSRDNIVEQLQRLGASCDWDREAFTMSGAPNAPEGEAGNFHDAVIRAFVQMYEDGLIYRGKRLVNWDPHFETAISDLEVENVDTPGHMWHFRYPLADGATYEYVERDADGAEVFRETRDYIAIATTRPETMLGDGAVAVHPSDERYAPIVGALCEIPVGPKEHRRLIPIVTDEYPDPTFGSGAVKITGAHDFNDYGVAKRQDIPLYRLMDTRAAMRADGAPYAEAAQQAKRLREGAEMSEAEVDAINLVPDHLRGLDRYDARARVVEEITAEGLAVMVPPTDPRLGPSPSPRPDPSPSSSGSTRGSPGHRDPRVEPEDDGITADGEPPLAPEEGGEARADQLVPLVEPKTITQPHGDRSKTVIEPMLTDQWFVDTAKIVGPAIEAVRAGTTRIHPERDAKTYFHWLENIEPWCISRQLWWGHRIPVWYGPAIVNGDISLAETKTFCAVNEAAVVEQMGTYYGAGLSRPFSLEAFDQENDPIRQAVDVRYARQLQNPGQQPMSGIINPHDSSVVRYRRDPDVLDTWFSSGLWPLGTLGWPDDTDELRRYFPTSTLVTGFDILFFWVARMMMMQTTVLPGDRPLAERVPFRDVYVHALVRDAKGQKMSKSLGNVLDPLDLIDQYGADAVRFTLAAMAAMGRDLKLSEDRIKGYRNFGTKLWNACRFAQMNGARFGGARGASAASATPSGDDARQYGCHTDAIPMPYPRSATNKWIVGETALCRADVDAALTAYRFDDAANALYRFVWNVVCDWYVELAKPLLDGEHADETRETMGWVLDRCMVMLHPFMPFVTEELWARTADRPILLVHADWPETLGGDAVDDEARSHLNWLISFVESIRSARAQVGVPGGETIRVLRLDEGDSGRAAYAANAALIDRLARIQPVEDAAESPKGSAIMTVGTARYALPLEGLIDPAKEAARLTKALGKLDKEIKGLSGRVGNPNFAASAPPDVVEETKANLAARQVERDAVAAALASVRELS